VVAPNFAEASAHTPSSTATTRADFENDAMLRSFKAGLVQKLHEAYRADGSEDSGLQCQIEFLLTPQGRVASSRILKSSGNRTFDAAVIDALRRVQVPPPPHAFSETPLTTTFQVVH
jgi:TonB family protein